MTITKSIIDHNNRAVALLEERNIKSAIANTVEAIRMQRQQIISGAGLPGPRPIGTRNHVANHTSIDQCILRTTSAENNDILLYINNINMSIYGHGIPLPDSVTDSTLISTILLFNVALAHQLLGANHHHHHHQAPTSCRHLVRARKLYELAYESHCQGEGGVLFPFVVINNLAVIEHSIGNTAKSMAYFDTLSKVLEGSKEKYR